MKLLLYPLLSLTTALLIIVVALLAQQNATPIALTFFNARSIDIPLGFVLTIAIALGLLTPPLLLLPGPKS